MRASFAVFLFTVAALGAAQAQRFEFSLSGARAQMKGAELGSLSSEEPQDTDTTLKPGWGGLARFTLNTPGYYGHEFGYYHSRPVLQTTIRPEDADPYQLSDRITAQQVSYNFLMYFMPSGERWRPFITVGVHTTKFGAPGFEEWTAGSARTYGANYGGGIKIRLFPHTLFRADIRDYLGGEPYGLHFEVPQNAGGIMRHQEYSIGLGFSF